MERAKWEEHYYKAQCLVADNDRWKLQKNDKKKNRILKNHKIIKKTRFLWRQWRGREFTITDRWLQNTRSACLIKHQ